jgi:uncharacterized protein (DUF305 family)
MPPLPTRLIPILATAFLAGACSSAPQQGASPVPGPAPAPAAAPDDAGLAKARADSARLPWTEADARFMTNMIGHHAQAIVMARLAPSHGASAAVQRLAERIINAQLDEIGTMQRWLRDRRQPVPEADATGPGMTHAHGHELMPGMLTEEQMNQLGQARGGEFDRLFLTYMIQHHRGAVAMVEQLFGSYGAGQDETVFKFASDVNVDQTTEIARMEEMLATLILERGSQ